MAVAKNKLQDIYSSAVTRLTELEAGQRQTLAQMYQKYHDTDEVARDDLNKNVSGKQELLTQEIESFVSNSVARIQSAVDMQGSLTNNCLKRCAQHLTTAARKFDEQLNRSQSRHDVLERDSLDELSAQFSSYVEQSLMGFLQAQNEWSQRLRDKHTDLRSDFEQAIVSGVAGLRQYEQQLTSTVQSAAMENMARLRNEAEKADEQLRTKYQEQANVLQAKLVELDTAFQKHHSATMVEAEARARESNQELSARLDKMYVAPASALADSIEKHKESLQKSFESGASVLTNLLEKTRADVAKAADERAAAIHAHAKAVRNHINVDVDTLMQKLNSNLRASSKLEQELHKDNEEISAKMRADLSNLFVSFKKGMDRALDKTVATLSRTCHRAEQEMSAVCKESQSSIEAISSKIQREIDYPSTQIVERIKQARKAAVEKVEQAAAGANIGSTAMPAMPEIPTMPVRPTPPVVPAAPVVPATPATETPVSTASRPTAPAVSAAPIVPAAPKPDAPVTPVAPVSPPANPAEQKTAPEADSDAELWGDTEVDAETDPYKSTDRTKPDW